MHVPKLKKKKWLIGIVGGIVLVCAAGYAILASQKNKTAEAVPQYQTMELEKQDLTKEIGLSGTLDSAHSESVSSTLEGVKVKEICVQVGDTVKEGDVLFLFDSTEIEKKLAEAQKSQSVEEAKIASEIKASERNYTDAQTTKEVEAGRNADNVNESTNDYNMALATKSGADAEYDKAKKNRQSKEEALKAAKETLKIAKEEEKNAKAALETAKTKNDEDAVKKAQKTVDGAAENKKKAESAKTAAEADLEAAKQTEAEKQAQSASAGEGVNAAADALKLAQQNKEDSERTNQKTLEDQKDTLESAKRTAAEGSESGQTVQDIKQQLDFCTVKAESSGVVTSINVKVGDTYTNGIMATIQDEKNYVVTAMVDQYDISDVSKGMSAIIKTETTGEEEMTGTISFVSPVPESAAGGTDGGNTSATGDYEIQIPVDNPSERLRIGMNAKVELIQEQVKNVFAVPSDCIMEKEDGLNYIQVLEQEEPREITVVPGLSTDYYTQVTAEGLEEGMKVIIPDVQMEAGADGEVSIY